MGTGQAHVAPVPPAGRAGLMQACMCACVHGGGVSFLSRVERCVGGIVACGPPVGAGLLGLLSFLGMRGRQLATEPGSRTPGS